MASYGADPNRNIPNPNPANPYDFNGVQQKPPPSSY